MVEPLRYLGPEKAQEWLKVLALGLEASDQKWTLNAVSMVLAGFVVAAKRPDLAVWFAELVRQARPIPTFYEIEDLLSDFTVTVERVTREEE
jgi:hypothetical protein